MSEQQAAPSQSRNQGGNQRGGNQRGGNQRGGNRRDQKAPGTEEEAPEFIDKVVFINRCAKVVKGGRRFSFSALVVSGDGKGRIGVGYGKAKEVPEAIRKGTEYAHRRMLTINLNEGAETIPHQVFGTADGGKVLLRPAAEGTGVIAGGGVRAVLEAVGIKNVLSKSLGSNNHLAVVNATLDGLLQLRTGKQIKELRSAEAEA